MSAARRGQRCPPDHEPYPSEFVAENAATLHRWLAPTCTSLEAFPCGVPLGDHWHVGHSTHVAGEACKRAHPFRRIPRY